MTKWISVCIGIIGLLFATTEASAATLNVVGGQLVGASGVDVNGTLYDVEFADGTCVDLFSGCDDASDFFIDPLNWSFFGAALLDQVFVGAYDSDPSLTAGCDFAGFCYLYTPDSLLSSGAVALKGILNSGGTSADGILVAGGSWLPTTDTTPMATYSYVVISVSPVPLPAGLPLLITGLGALGLMRLRKRKSE